jgi:hypothetical protein
VRFSFDRLHTASSVSEEAALSSQKSSWKLQLLKLLVTGKGLESCDLDPVRCFVHVLIAPQQHRERFELDNNPALLSHNIVDRFLG